MVDLHGQFVDKGIELAMQSLKKVKEQLATDRIKPNWNGELHVFKVICGAGLHSHSGKGRMKFMMKR